MKKIFLTLLAILVFGIASAQVNRIEPKETASPPPASPGTVTPTSQHQQGLTDRNPVEVPASSTSTFHSPIVAPPSNVRTLPAPSTTQSSTTTTLQPGVTSQGIGTPINTSGSVNPTNTVPATTTTNQGRLP